jgi:hypothetical protein
MSALGELSRPLNDDRAAMLARQLASSVVQELQAGGSVDEVLGACEIQIRNEIRCAANRRSSPQPSRARKTLSDVLPDF